LSYLLCFSSESHALPVPYPLSLHAALPILGRECPRRGRRIHARPARVQGCGTARALALYSGLSRPSRAVSKSVSSRTSILRRGKSEEHTSELQSRENLVCRLLLEKKKNKRR